MNIEAHSQKRTIIVKIILISLIIATVVRVGNAKEEKNYSLIIFKKGNLKKSFSDFEQLRVICLAPQDVPFCISVVFGAYPAMSSGTQIITGFRSKKEIEEVKNYVRLIDTPFLLIEYKKTPQTEREYLSKAIGRVLAGLYSETALRKRRLWNEALYVFRELQNKFPHNKEIGSIAQLWRGAIYKLMAEKAKSKDYQEKFYRRSTEEFEKVLKKYPQQRISCMTALLHIGLISSNTPEDEKYFLEKLIKEYKDLKYMNAYRMAENLLKN